MSYGNLIFLIMKKIILLSVILLLAGSCKKTPMEPIGPTDVRIRNLSDLNMTEVIVNTGGGEYNFGTINGLDSSDYHRFEKAYQKANITAIINGQKYKTDTAIYTYMIYLGQVKATCRIWIENAAQKKLAMSWIYDSDLQ